jgi:DNA polymerase III epsilon subunit-like protein
VLNLAKPADMQAHRALADVLMTYELWKHLTALVSNRMNGQVAGVDVMRAIQRKSKALTEPFLARLASVQPTIAKATSNANG